MMFESHSISKGKPSPVTEHHSEANRLKAATSRPRTGRPGTGRPRLRPARPDAGRQQPYQPAGDAPTSLNRGAPTRTQRLDATAGLDRLAAIDAVRLAVGQVVGTHGVQGEMKLALWTDTPEHLRQVAQVWVGDEPSPRRLTSMRLTGDRALIRLAGVGNVETARTFVGQRLLIAGADAQPLVEGELFLYQLVGLTVVTEDGETLGTIADVMETGANDVLVIRPAGGGDILYPHHREFVTGVDLDAGTMTVRRLDYYN